MIEITNEKTCTGCGACAAVCPQGAIQLIEDRKGFRKPVINQESCIDCELCKKTCAEKIEFRKPKVLVSQGIESRTCCDPTVLAGVDCFEKITADPIMKEDYVFVFMIWDSPRLLENAKKFAQANGLKIINNKSSLEFFLHCKPEEFLSWIKNASFVFTNSFHGTVFSLLFHKRFVSSICKNNNEKNLRVKELMIYLGCENNIINDENSQIETIKKLDYDMIEKKLQNMREESMIYLKKSLGTS